MHQVHYCSAYIYQVHVTHNVACTWYILRTLMYGFVFFACLSCTIGFNAVCTVLLFFHSRIIVACLATLVTTDIVRTMTMS